MKRVIGTVSVAILVGFLTTSASANLLSNGSFEGGTYSGPNGDNVANGWTLLPTTIVAQSNFNIQNTVNPPTFQGPENGLFYAVFSSAATDGSQDCFVQNFSTIVGHQYTVSFWVAITAAPVAFTQLIPQWDWALADQNNMINSFYFAPTNSGPVNYQHFTFQETAAFTTSNLMFHGTDASGAILLDNVVVTDNASAPEPASLLLIGTGLLMAALRRR